MGRESCGPVAAAGVLGSTPVRATGGGKVGMHTGNVVIYNPTFVVQPAGRQKVLDQRKKNVHAFVRGDYWASHRADDPSGSLCGAHLRYAMSHLEECVRVTYNPYKAGHFVDVVVVVFANDEVEGLDETCDPV